ncbi:hypothetical protein SCUCBS95973_009498 [Sporothrix curviconia]|uniref:Large ribosomal subunit protein mL50 n=1 Tax=Sporothrix curviconia TaxID=1260050 RepID=A0ABP0CYX2_9PEZI
MRRIARLPKPAVADAALAARNSSSNSRCAFRCHAAAPTTASSSTITRPRTSNPSSFCASQLTHGRFFSTSGTRRQAGPKQPLDDAATAAPATELEAEVDEWESAPEIVEDESSLIIPGRIQVAPKPDQVADSSYVPAETGDGLEEVGGLEGWWENDQHWDQSVVFRGFAPQEHVTDAATLEVLARQAVLEAVAVQQQQNPELLTRGAWARGSDAQAALALQVEVAADGSVAALRGDVDGVVSGLAAQQEENVGEDAALPTAEQAQSLVASWAEDVSWKSISLNDVALKFAINKRILQLTGHMLPDAQLAKADTVGALLAVLVRPPKAKKLAEELAADGALAGLPNVAVYGRRVTPIDKHKAVGRWKVIVEELEKRGLPVTGTGGYDKAIERKWAYH